MDNLFSNNSRKRPDTKAAKDQRRDGNSLKSMRSENHTPRFHLFNRSIRPYIL